MIDISIELPELELYSVIYDDGYFKFNGYSMRSSFELNKIKSYVEEIATLFFQTECTINTEFINSIDGNHEEIAYEFAHLLFDNFEKARVMFLALNKDYKFNEIVVSFEGVNEPSIYEVDGITYDVYYPNELINVAQQHYYDYINDMSFDEFIDNNIDALKEYIPFMNILKLAGFIRIELTHRELLSTVSNSTFNNDIEIINTFIDMDDDYSTKSFVIDTITENDLFNAWEYSQKMMNDEIEALNYLVESHSTLVFENNENAKRSIYVLERN